MIEIRPMRVEDVEQVQNLNLQNLPENYQFKFYLYHLMTWPQLSWVAEDTSQPGLVAGYVLAKMEDDVATSAPVDPSKPTPLPHGHISSLAVHYKYRRLGLAETLMLHSQKAMLEIYGAHYVTLHVRLSNESALRLYRDKMKFTAGEIEKGYYADGEDAMEMRFEFRSKDVHK